MRFDYQMYLKSDLYVPLCASLFCVVLVVSAIVGIIQHLESKARFEYVVFICFTLLLATVFVTQVIRGIPILKDRDLETLEVSGKIEKIEDITFGSRHYVGSDVRSSVYVTVNGVRYYSVTLPGIGVGDCVKLEVFKYSKFVSSCEKVLDDENSQMDYSD